MGARVLRWAGYWREVPVSTRWGCTALIGIIAIASVIIDPRAKPTPQIRRLRTVLAAHHISCESPYYWWSEPKGRTTLNCDRFEIDAFNNPAEVATFVHRARSPRQADVLRRFGASAYLVAGRRWLVITPSSRIAYVAARALGGRTLVISKSR
ncbi:MAG: hypothetical protein M3P18_23410 [Actinomycetota bacterium]|nr:hypothetical protein [Actinomycetota bacterium]